MKLKLSARSETNGAAVVYLSLGANLANQRGVLIQAIREIFMLPETEVKKVSSLYRTQPVGFQEQPFFLNLVLEINTKLCSTCLLLALQAVETRLGRVRTMRWGPRIVDIDIISYEKRVQNEVFLTIPHPRMADRNFVLIPFNEIAHDYIVPKYNLTVGEILAKAVDRSWVKKETEITLSGIIK